jgi:hypothetical protein
MTVGCIDPLPPGGIADILLFVPYDGRTRFSPTRRRAGLSQVPVARAARADTVVILEIHSGAAR